MNHFATPIFNYCKALYEHDWTYEFGDDHSVWQRGRASLGELRQLQPKIDPDFVIWNKFAPSDFQRKPQAPAPVPRTFDAWWTQIVADNGGAEIGADYRHWAMLGAKWAASTQAPAVTHGWQPIETAPKDGTRFLAMNDGWHEFFHWQDGANEHTKGWPTGWRSSFTVYQEGTGPTHWMPLPAAPQTKEPTNDR